MSTWGGWGGGWGDDQEEDEDEYGPSRQYSVSKDSLILLIDTSSGMFEDNDGEVPFELCIKCVKSVLLNKIVSNDKDSVAVIFFGTNKHKNPNDFKNVYILQELDTPDAPRIKEIEEMLTSEDFDDFSNKFGHSDAYSMSDVLWTCSTMLATSAAKNSHKRILLFTNNDSPHATSPSLQRQAKTRAKDLLENGVEIDLMHIGSSFDVSAFYQDIVSTGDEDDIVSLPNPSEKFEELLTRVRSKEFKKRAMQRISLSLGPGLDLGVGVYCLVREAKKPSFVRLDQRTNEELKTQTKMLCDDTGAELMPTDIKYYQEFGGEKVIFEKEEVTEIKKLCDRGLTLMGFKPRSKLKRHMYIKPSSFIYPDESEITGSSRLFSALLDRCLARDVVAVCRYTPTSNAAPRFVALVPQKEEVDENSVQVSAPGFHVVFLPFAEELRNVQVGEQPTKASVEQIDKAKDIIKKLTFNFKSDDFENPLLQKHYRQLEAIALEYESVEEITDLTEPNEDRISKRAGNLLEQFKTLVYPADYDPTKKPGTKRKAASADGGSSKRAKTDSGPVDVEATARSGKLSSLKVAELKDYLKSVGKKAVGKKQDLIDAVKEHLGL